MAGRSCSTASPGSGSRVCSSEAARSGRERGMAVLAATGVQSEANLPFAGLHQLLRPVRERAGELPRGSARRARRRVRRDRRSRARALPDRDGRARSLSEVAADAPAAARRRRRAVARPPDRGGARVRRPADRVRPGALAGRGARRLPRGDSRTPGCRSTGSPASTTRRRRRWSTRRPGPCARRCERSVLREAAGNPLALLELPAAGGEQSPSGGLPLTERLERAFAGRVADLPGCHAPRCCWSARSATRTPSTRSSRRRAPSPGRSSSSRRWSRPSRRRSIDLEVRRDPLPAPAHPLGDRAERRRAAASPCPRGARRRARRRSRTGACGIARRW